MLVCGLVMCGGGLLVFLGENDAFVALRGES